MLQQLLISELCSARNEVDAAEVMKKHGMHLIAVQMLPLHAPRSLSDLIQLKLVKTVQPRSVCHTAFTHPDKPKGSDKIHWQMR